MMRASIRYTLARLFLFFGCLLVGWLLGLRDSPVLLLLIAATVSLALSALLLGGMRDRMSEEIATGIERRRDRRAHRRRDEVLADDEAEDLEAGIDRDRT